jgi:hypothetical protein
MKKKQSAMHKKEPAGKPKTFRPTKSTQRMLDKLVSKFHPSTEAEIVRQCIETVYLQEFFKEEARQ